MDDTQKAFLRWCAEQRAEAQRAYELYSTGVMRFVVNGTDISAEQMTSLERVVVEMDALTARVKTDIAQGA